MIDLNDYYYFVHVIDKKGFSPAAKALDMPKSRLSRHVAKLEDRLDTKLIQRTSRQFYVTEAGQIFYRHAKAVLDEMEAAEASIQARKATLSGKVTMSCSVGVAQFALKDVVLQFLLEHPGLDLVQQVTNQEIDLVSSGIDMAIRGHTEPLPDSSIIQRHLATVTWHLFASPSYLAKTDPVSSPHDLIKRQSLKLGWQPSGGHWNLQNCDGLRETVPFKPQLCSDDMSTLKSAAIRGLGIVSLPAYICRDEIAQGTLIRVLPDWVSGKAELSLLMPTRKGLSPAVRTFSEFLIQNLSNQIRV